MCIQIDYTHNVNERNVNKESGDDTKQPLHHGRIRAQGQPNEQSDETNTRRQYDHVESTIGA